MIELNGQTRDHMKSIQIASTYPSNTISALAGTSRSIVLHLTVLIPFFLVMPAKRYLSRPSGTGDTAENTVAGSPPIIIAASILLFFSFR